ncbi:MAG: hypothetical protein LQ338_005800 [Usnochroma carphineum]|nr:MAG: hypothetical protein LQ338_005800 [Usnochroma carphineum]
MASLRLACSLIIAALAVLGSTIAVRGIQAGVDQGTGKRPFRLEFSTFKNSGPAFDLYILSLRALQKRDQSTLLSYFGVAGIHGVPFRSWDGVTGDNYAGYCPHASTLFPTWHRPYMALYEQVVWYYAQQIAASYPQSQRARYREAAWTFRIPYWDWSITPTMPPEVNQPTIFINAPNGTLNVVNPLYNYTFHPQPSNTDFPPNVGPNGGTPVSSYHSTVRYPNAAGQSQPDRANMQLQANGAALHTLTYQLITQQSNYGPFSNTGFSDGRGQHYNSIENMHNGIHMLVGNGGHMSNIPYSSFDPIFWLHHANVDRLFALWQAIYPNATVTPQANAAGTFTDAPGITEDVNTPLTPFRSDDNGHFWTSGTVWSTRTFGYTYPEIMDWGVSSDQLTSNVKASLNALYNPSGSISQRSMSANASNDLQLSPNAMDVQWFANVKLQVSSMTSPFFVHLFLGEAPADTATWSFATNLVGTHSVVDTSLLRAVSPDSPATLYGQVPLNHALLAAGNSDLAPSNIVPLLTSQLNWRLQYTDDSPLDISLVPSLKIHVVGQEVKPRATEDQFPEYGQMQVYKEVTNGKAGGLGNGDDPN